MNSLTKIIMPVLLAGTLGMYSCNKQEEQKADNVSISGIRIEKLIPNDNSSFTFSNTDGKVGYDRITGKHGYSYIHYTTNIDFKNEHSVVMGDSTIKYLTRLHEDLQKIEEFTKKDYESTMKNK
ncbi:MAG: hypothetical protein ACP5N2_02460 [Candidatus Nanoarchaeia archaeon]